MVWDDTDKSNLLLVIKDLSVKMGQVIARKTDLGQPIDGYLDYYYLICNLGFAVEEGASDFTNDEMDYLNSLYIKCLTKHNRYKGI